MTERHNPLGPEQINPEPISPESAVFRYKIGDFRHGEHIGIKLDVERTITPEDIRTPTPEEVVELLETFRSLWKPSIPYDTRLPVEKQYYARQDAVDESKSRAGEYKRFLTLIGQAELVDKIINPPDPVGKALAESKEDEMRRRENSLSRRIVRKATSFRER